MARRKKVGYRVFVGIEKFQYDPKVGSNQRTILDGNVQSTHGDWSMGDHDKLEKADNVIASMVHIQPTFDPEKGCRCGPGVLDKKAGHRVEIEGQLDSFAMSHCTKATIDALEQLHEKIKGKKVRLTVEWEE